MGGNQFLIQYGACYTSPNKKENTEPLEIHADINTVSSSQERVLEETPQNCQKVLTWSVLRSRRPGLQICETLHLLINHSSLYYIVLIDWANQITHSFWFLLHVQLKMKPREFQMLSINVSLVIPMIPKWKLYVVIPLSQSTASAVGYTFCWFSFSILLCETCYACPWYFLYDPWVINK